MKKKKKKRGKIKKEKKRIFFDLSPDVKKSILGVIFIFFAIFFTLCLFDAAGEAGSATGKVLDLFFGFGSWIIIILFCFIGGVFFFSERKSPYASTITGSIIFLFSIFGIFELISENLGGYFGNVVASFPKNFFGKIGSWFFFMALILISISLIFNISIFRKRKKKKDDLQKINIGGKPYNLGKLEEGKAKLKIKEIFPISLKEKKEDNSNKKNFSKISNKNKANISYEALPVSLLDKEGDSAVSGNLRANAQIIKRTFQNFGIDVEMGEVNIGPTVTQYTLKPAEGTKLSKILSLHNDLALSLAAHPIRIEAPIPGRSLVGIEIPNTKRAGIRLANFLSSSEFKSLPELAFAAGKDVRGKPHYCNIAKMPHLLVAGATGAGKTVFLNSLIISLLWRNSPQELKMVLIDPKRVEFSLYESLPHLFCPPVTSHSKVIPVIKWLVSEMENRFSILQKAKKREIVSYNKFVEKIGKKEKKETNKEKSIEDEDSEFEKLPYIVLIIDELADIISAKGKEFEAEIVRLAQMSRAIGIHLVLATQRPSVEVLTGLIKANVTSRVAFQVASQIDSRTILDSQGAEKLLGRGDMLLLSGDASKPLRYQSPYVSSSEIKNVVEYIKAHQKDEDEKSNNSLKRAMEESQESNISNEKNGDDILFEEAKRIVISAKKASASFLQRRLRIGYSRAARILDMLESEGTIGPQRGSKAREVFLKEEDDDDESNGIDNDTLL